MDSGQNPAILFVNRSAAYMHKFFSCLRDPTYLNLPVCELSARLRQIGIWESFEILLGQKIGSQATTGRFGSQVGTEADLVRRQATGSKQLAERMIWFADRLADSPQRQIYFADRLADSSQTGRFGSQTGW